LPAAQGALRKSEEDLRAVSGSILYPAVNAKSSGRPDSASLAMRTWDQADTFNLYNASVGVSYTLDLFGGGRRQIEAYQATDRLSKTTFMRRLI